MAKNINQRYWETKEMLDFLSDALFVGELNDLEIKRLHGQLCFAARCVDIYRFFSGSSRGIRLKSITSAQQKEEAKDEMLRLRNKTKGKK